ncbi:MBG domain-containing protein [Fulvivirga ulvae]|uniref:MBG domain-containing protein n=1 Tax=Fulvivirga ulvae TaxID=2904245 RepID=UPI001F393583|nr:MBG domain-containing protein [Fulvivirga ulvae]UII30955.1 MBG domain-containing protein [Fulvivirga ulvae]
MIITFTSIYALLAAQPEFTSTPVEEGKLDENYEYNITTSDWWFFTREIILSGGTLPGGIELKDNGDGTAELEGKPNEAGTFPIEIMVRRVYDNTQYSVQSFTLTIHKKEGTITLHDLNVTYNGAPYIPGVTTSPSGLVVDLTYNGSATTPVNAGSYTVEATINDPQYEGNTSGILTIAKAHATVQLADISPIYNGSPRQASATTIPNGLAVDFLYDGEPIAPTNAGIYELMAVISDLNYTGSATGTFTIQKKEAVVTLSNLIAAYDGSAKPVTVTTDPAGLNVRVTYNGTVSPPVDKGTYAVEAEVREQNYFGEVRATLVINDNGDDGGDGTGGRPVISNLESEPILYRQGDPGIAVSQTLIINDFDDTEMEGATVMIDVNYFPDEDMLLYNNKENKNITADFDQEHGLLTLTGTDTRSNYEIALSKVHYKNRILGETNTVKKRVSITVDDGSYKSSPVSRDINIYVLPELDIVNAFTPNGDNVNDYWNFVNLELYSVISISIFDYNGTEVFRCQGEDCVWDGRYNGKLLPAGAYFYTIDLDNGKRKYRGTVTLLR